MKVLVMNIKVDRQKRLCELLLVLLLLFLYFLLKALSVPRPQYRHKEYYDEIDWARFRPEAYEMFQPREVTNTVPLEQEATSQEEELDRSSPNDYDYTFDVEPEFITIENPGQSMVRDEPVEMEMEGLEPFRGLDAFNVANNKDYELPSSLWKRGEGVDSGISIRRENRKPQNEEINYEAGRNPRNNIPEGKRITDPKILKVKLYNLSDFGKDYEDLSPIYNSLAQWMKSNPAAFPEVVKRFMGYDSLNLTSKTEFQVKDRYFEMYLLCKERIYELRICLIEGNQSILLIDRGFKKRSNYLRVGIINRMEDSTILSFGTRQEAASDQRTKEFYQIFLSWWQLVDKTQWTKTPPTNSRKF